MPARSANGETSEKLSVCWKKCEVGEKDSCAEGTSCRSVKNPFGDMGAYCVAPFDPCPNVEDGVCDDPTGSGVCAAGTDNRDCQCNPRIPDSSCDPVTQCGCSSGSTCVANLVEGTTDKWTAECEQAGTVAVGGTCEFQKECAPGLLCDGITNTCVKYCGSDADCGSGACQFNISDFKEKFGRCREACKAGDDSTCADGNVCAEIDHTRLLFALNKMFTKSGSFCFIPIAANICPKDGVCDEPSGTNVCAAGGDPDDCCQPPAEGGACNPYKQCGCEGIAGTSCVLTNTEFNGTACVPPGKLPAGAVCTGQSDQCEAGYGCFGYVCRKYCEEPADCGGHPNLCLKPWDEDMKPAKYGYCMSKCDPGAADSCPAGTVCAIIGDDGVTGCMTPDVRTCDEPNGRCDDTRPGGRRMCEIGTDKQDCCPNIAAGAECEPEGNCGCERKPGTHCVQGDGAPTCQPIHAEPLSNSCENVSDPSCCNPPVVGSECDPVQQCGCEDKPNTHCQVIDSSGVAGCMKYGGLPPGSVCSSAFEQCGEGYDCHLWDSVCRKACTVHTDCNFTNDGVTVNEVCLQRDGEGVGHCMVTCDFDSEAPCAAGTRCARFGEDTTVCWKPGSQCGLTDNGVCDDTRSGGTRLCAYGRDPECSKQ